MTLRPTRLFPVLAMACLFTACGGRAADSMLLRESFSSDDTYSRTVPGAPGQACEAARRTLLSQGYAIARAGDDMVEGSKNFQPAEEVHEQLVLRIACAPRDGKAQVFVSAVQDRYALKKSPTSASVGVGAFGSVSLPFGSNDDSLVKVASSTVQDGEFYRHFFERLQQYLGPVVPPPPAAAEGPPAPAAVTEPGAGPMPAAAAAQDASLPTSEAAAPPAADGPSP